MSVGPVVNEPEPPADAEASAPLAPPLVERAASHRLLLLMLGLITGWCLLMQRFGSQSNIYVVMGPFALSVLSVIAALSSHELRRWFRVTRLAVSSGLLVGVGMTLATYPAFALLRGLMPALQSDVAVLYAAAHQTTLGEALPWVVTIIVAEELLWRGALLYVLERRVSPALAMSLSVASYALAQLGTGSWIVMLLALVCGTIWTIQRHYTRSLLSPLIAHLIWTPIVILLHPVTSVGPM
jgi:membrane protease YdiL (CAAX protease family)